MRAHRSQLRWSSDAPRSGAQNLAGLLFPVPTGPLKSRPSVAAAYVTGVVAIAATALLRQSGLPATSTIWAEDGRIFTRKLCVAPSGTHW